MKHHVDHFQEDISYTKDVVTKSLKFTRVFHLIISREDVSVQDFFISSFATWK